MLRAREAAAAGDGLDGPVESGRINISIMLHGPAEGDPNGNAIGIASY